MGEVRACVYFSVIFLCIQISAAKPFFGNSFWCEFFCERDDGSTTTASSDADYMDEYCDGCFPPTTPRPPRVTNSATPSPPGVFMPPGPLGFNQAPGMGPGPVNYFMMNPPQNGGTLNVGPDPNRNGWLTVVWNTLGGSSNANTPPPNATPAPVVPPTTAAAAPAAAATTVAPAVTTAAPAAPAARK